MTTATGKWQLIDFDEALVLRGFDSLQQSERFSLINLGYRYVARKFPWSWERTSQTYTVAPGSAFINVGTGLPGGLTSIESIDITTDPYRSHLRPEDRSRFVNQWQSLDLTAVANRGTPARYYYYLGNIYLLPPPSVSVQVTVYFKQYLPDMLLNTDTTVLPQAFDEVILDAALVRVHQRAHELALANDAMSRVDDALQDLLANDVWEMEELQERVDPDDQWY